MSNERAWLQSPHAAALLSFHLQPTRWLHASRWRELLPPTLPAPADDDAARHRQLSPLLLQRLSAPAQRHEAVERPEWVLALAPRALWLALLRRLALVRLQRRLRHAIRRDDARAVAATLDASALAFARERAAAFGPADDRLDEAPLPALLRQLEGLGAATLLRALGAAPPAIAERAAWRLPSATAMRELEVDDLPGAAFARSHAVLADLDPRWTSSFPASR